MGGLRGKGTVATWVAAVVLALAPAAQSSGARGAERRSGLARVFAEPCTPVELRRRLQAVESAEVPLLFFFAAEGRLPDGDAGDPARIEEQRGLVREALAARPRRELVPFLEDMAARPQGTSVRLEAQRLIGAIGTGEQLRLLTRWTAPPQAGANLAPELRAGLTRALTAILARDPTALPQFPGLLSESPPGMASSIVEALAATRSAQATRLLASLLGRMPGLDGLLLTRLAERARPLEGDEATFDAVRRYLRQRDATLVCAAARVCGQLRDDGAVETLVALMEHGDERVRRSVFDALQRISGLDFGPDAARWTSWYHAEMRWWEEEADSLLANIERARGLEFMRAAREVLEHRLYRDRIAESFVQALGRDNAAEVRSACQALEQLGSTQAVDALVECLERDDPLVRAAAWKALRKLTGADLPPERSSWVEFVG